MANDCEFDLAKEFEHADLGDKRLNRRLVGIMRNFEKNPGSIIQRTQKTWAEMMGAYRFFGNDAVSPEAILKPHRDRTLERMAAHERVVAIQDTTTLCYSSHPSTEGLGSIAQGAHGSGGQGILLHTTIACALNGTPLGILGHSMWSRSILKEGDELFESERQRWRKGIELASGSGAKQVICVADREADGSDVFAAALREGMDFVFRAKEKSRVEPESGEKILASMLRLDPVGEMKLSVRAKAADEKKKRNAKRKTRVAAIEVRAAKFTLKPQKQPKILPAPTAEERTITAVLATEKSPPAGYAPVNWLLFTNLAADGFEGAKAAIDAYKVRWEIEVFHKVLKSACEAEKAQLETADRLKRMLACLTVAAWRLHLLAKLQREVPDEPCTSLLEDQEWKALCMLDAKSRKLPPQPPTLREATLMIAKLGGFLGRKSDGEPGTKSLWIGWHKLIHCTEMYMVMKDAE